MTPNPTDEQANRLWEQICRERTAGRTRRFFSPEKVVAWLRRQLRMSSQRRRRRR